MSGKVMSPRLVVGRADKDGHLPLPREIDGVVVWDDMQQWSDGVTREYRVLGTSRLILVHKGPSVTRANGVTWCLSTVEVPAATLDGANAAFDKVASALRKSGTIAAVFEPSIVDGGAVFTSLESATGEAANIARAILAERKRRTEAAALAEVKQ